MPFKPLTQQSNNRTAFEFWIEDIIANIVGKRKKKKKAQAEQISKSWFPNLPNNIFIFHKIRNINILFIIELLFPVLLFPTSDLKIS